MKHLISFNESVKELTTSKSKIKVKDSLSNLDNKKKLEEIIKNKLVNSYSQKEIKDLLKEYSNEDIFCLGCDNGIYWMVKLAIRNGLYPEHPIWRKDLISHRIRYTCLNGYFDIAKLLIDNGGDVHYKNDEALRYAVWHNDMKSVKFLIDNGADVHMHYKVPEYLIKHTIEKDMKDMFQLLKTYYQENLVQHYQERWEEGWPLIF